MSALLRSAAYDLADGMEFTLRQPLSERELATVRRLDAQLVAAIERYPRVRRRYLYSRLRSVLRSREVQASMEPQI